MDQYYFSVTIDDQRLLCLAPLTDRRLAMVAEPIEDTSGYFLFEQRGAEIDIIAHVVSEEAVERLRAMFGMN